MKSNMEIYEKKDFELIIRSLIKPIRTPEKKYDLQSFCMVATKELKEEALITLKTLRIFHSQPVYVVCDQETKDLLEEVDNLKFNISAGSESLKEIKEKHFKTLYKDLKTFHKVECIFKKMDAIGFALSYNENTFFIDADLIILGKLDEELNSEIMLSPHYHAAGKSHLSSFYGFFNAGYIFCANKTFPNFWRDIYLTKSKFYEQECMNRIPQYYEVNFFDESHNIGFWRDKSLSPKEKVVMDFPKDAKSFHIHMSKDFDFGKNKIVERKNSEFKDLVLDYLYKNKPNVYSKIKETLKTPDKIAFVHLGKCAGVYTQVYLRKNVVNKYKSFNSWWGDWVGNGQGQFTNEHLATFKKRTVSDEICRSCALGRFDLGGINLGRDWSSEELIEIANVNTRTGFTHNHGINWTRELILEFKKNNWFTFTFLRDPREIICSLYSWSKKLEADLEKQGTPGRWPTAKGPPLKNIAMGISNQENSSELSLNDFFKFVTKDQGSRRLWVLPDYIDDLDHVAEFNDVNFGYFLNKYFDHEYKPAAKENVSPNKGYKYYCDNGEISEENQRIMGADTEFKRYSKYLR